MRTTLTIDDEVLAAAKGLAARQRKTVGEVISALSRHALQPTAANRTVGNGVPLLANRAGTPPVTPELVTQRRDELP